MTNNKNTIKEESDFTEFHFRFLKYHALSNGFII